MLGFAYEVSSVHVAWNDAVGRRQGGHYLNLSEVFYQYRFLLPWNISQGQRTYLEILL